MSVRHFVSLRGAAWLRQVLPALLAIAALAAFSPRPQLRLSGRVTSASGAPAANMMVVAHDRQRRITTAGTTDAGGRYRLDGLAVGVYRIAVMAEGAEVASRDSVDFRASTVVDLRAGAPKSSGRRSSDILNLLPEGEEKRRFVLDCTGCHQMDERTAAPGGTARTADQWDEAVTRMLRYSGATTGFPVISAYREPRATAEWLAQHMGAIGTAASGTATAEKTVASAIVPARAVITEYELPAPQDLPHDVAVAGDGKIVITGMMTGRLYTLDPATGAFDTIPIPVPRANPRAIEIDAKGDWWVLLGAPKQMARYRPGTKRWTTWDIGVYPHSVALDGAGRAWFNGHFTRDPELLGHVGPDSGAATNIAIPPHPTMAAIPGGPIPYELRSAPDGRIWMSELQGNRLIAHRPGTTEFDVFEMPVSFSGPRRFDIDKRGTVWIPAYAASTLVRLDPATRVFTSHPLPVRDAVPYVARADSATGRIWVGTSAADAVFAFDPATERWATYPLPSRGALVRHMAIDYRTGDLWLAYGASPGIAARVARLSPR